MKAKAPAPVDTTPLRSWSFTVDGPPIPKQRPRIERGHARTPQRTLAYEAAIWAAARRAGLCTLRPVSLAVWVWPGDLRPIDLDNLLKSVCDGLIKDENVQLLPEDHWQAIPRKMIEIVDVDRAAPRIVVDVAEVRPWWNTKKPRRKAAKKEKTA